MTSRPDPSTDATAMPEHVGHQIQTINDLFVKTERRAGKHQLAIERLMDLFGRPATAYTLACAFAGWILANTLSPHLGIRPLDPPPFSLLQCMTCIAALLMTVAILAKQNRGAKLAQQRMQLDLQVNLIAEEKIAKLISLIEELRRDLPSVKNREDLLANAMTEAVDLHAVANELQAIQEGGEPPP